MTEIFTGVLVFDGERMLDGPMDVTVEGGVIASMHPGGDGERIAVVDGGGCTLLPGLIDAHVHLRGPDDVRRLAGFGVTTSLDMGSWPPAMLDGLRAGGAVRSTGPGAVGPESPLAHLPGRPADSIVADEEGGRRFVAARVAEGAEYIKVIVDPARGGVGAAAMSAIVEAAHAARAGAIDMAQAAGVDVLTHSPIDADLDPAGIAAVLSADRTVVPTLVMVRGVASGGFIPGLDYAHARDFVTALHAAGAAVVLGTDANQAQGVPANVPYGESAHTELELLVDAGLTPADALRAATSVAADRFALADRGRIAPGLRADLLLVEGDPTVQIEATRRVRAVRVAGAAIEVAGSAT